MHALIISLVVLGAAGDEEKVEADTFTVDAVPASDTAAVNEALTSTDATPEAVAAVDADGTPWESPPLLRADGNLTSSPNIQPQLPEADHHYFGAQVDVGVPDGLAASLNFQPLKWLRFSLGGLTNAASFGVRASILVMPFHGVFRPTLSADGGHYFPGNMANAYGIQGSMASPLQRVSYDYASGHLGFEVGSSRLSFFMRGGVTYIDGTMAPLTTDGGSTGAIRFRSLLPSLKLGVVLCFG